MDGQYQESDKHMSFPTSVELMRKIDNKPVVFQVRSMDNTFDDW